MGAARPNLVVVSADELRPDALGVYGNDAVDTANVDAMARDGLVFEEAYTVSPWCLPARASLATGSFPVNSGAFTNYRDWNGRLDPGIPNVYSQLRASGYHTAHFGKCHYAPSPVGQRVPGEMVSYDGYPAYYRELGMDHLELQDGKHISAWFYDDYSEALEEAGYLEAYKRALFEEDNGDVYAFPGPAEWHPDSWVAGRAVEYLENYDREEPLFAWVSFSGPHYPFDPPEASLDDVDVAAATPRSYDPGEFDDETKIHAKSYHGCDDVRRVDANGLFDATSDLSEEYWTELRRHYYGNVALIDDLVGDLLSRIEATLGTNTLVVFLADHGEMAGDHSLWGKHNCAYEPVWRIPLVVTHLGNERYEGSTDARTQLVDVTATLLDAADVPTGAIDGVPADRLIEHGGREYVFAEGGGFAAVKHGSKKYVHVHQRGEQYHELYDLDADPNEFHDVSAHSAHRDTVARLRGVLLGRYLDSTMPYYQRPTDI